MAPWHRVKLFISWKANIGLAAASPCAPKRIRSTGRCPCRRPRRAQHRLQLGEIAARGAHPHEQADVQSEADVGAAPPSPSRRRPARRAGRSRPGGPRATSGSAGAARRDPDRAAPGAAAPAGAAGAVAASPRQSRPGGAHHPGAGDEHRARPAAHAALRSSREQLAPPNANAFTSAVRTAARRARAPDVGQRAGGIGLDAAPPSAAAARRAPPGRRRRTPARRRRRSRGPARPSPTRRGASSSARPSTRAQGRRLDRVVERRRRAVGLHVVDARLARAGQRRAHRAFGAVAVGIGRGQVMGVERSPLARQLHRRRPAGRAPAPPPPRPRRRRSRRGGRRTGRRSRGPTAPPAARSPPASADPRPRPRPRRSRRRSRRRGWRAPPRRWRPRPRRRPATP